MLHLSKDKLGLSKDKRAIAEDMLTFPLEQTIPIKHTLSNMQMIFAELGMDGQFIHQILVLKMQLISSE